MRTASHDRGSLNISFGYVGFTSGPVVQKAITVEPVYNGHLRDFRNWPLNAGGRLIQDQ